MRVSVEQNPIVYMFIYGCLKHLPQGKMVCVDLKLERMKQLSKVKFFALLIFTYLRPDALPP